MSVSSEMLSRTTLLPLVLEDRADKTTCIIAQEVFSNLER